MVGTNIGAGQRDRALRAAWIGAGIAAGLTEVIGLSAAAFPHAWLSLFDTDPVMLDAGSRYLYAVGPFYGLLGLGLALYFASQGAGRLLWPLLANLVRLAIAAGGGWVALRWSAAKTYETSRSEEHTSELQSPCNLVCRLLLEKKKKIK